MPLTPLQSFYYLLGQLGLKDIEVLKRHNVTSFKHLSTQSQEQVVNTLNEEWKSRSKRPRGAVIHYLCIMPGYNFKTLTDEPNYEMIDEFVKGIGSNNPNKKPLNKLNLSELNKVVSQVKAMYRRQIGKA